MPYATFVDFFIYYHNYKSKFIQFNYYLCYKMLFSYL